MKFYIFADVSHTQHLSHTICLPPYPFSFLPLPSHFTSGVLRSSIVFWPRRIMERYPPIQPTTLGNETGFENMMSRIRENWQCKLDTVIDFKEAEFESPCCPDSEDFCLPMNGMQRSRACSLFRPSCQTYETKRCMLSL